MKTIKVLFFLIILGSLGTIGYQNQEYFLTNMALHIDITLLKKTFLQYTAMELPNWSYWGICFVLGLLIASLRGMVKAFKLGREIKAHNLRIDTLKAEINTLKTELDVYIHDPYIKRHLENKAAEAKAAEVSKTAEKDGKADAPKKGAEKTAKKAAEKEAKKTAEPPAPQADKKTVEKAAKAPEKTDAKDAAKDAKKEAPKEEAKAE